MTDVSVTPRRSPDRRCSFCHDSGEGLEECAKCGALVHADCRATHGRCPTLGCSSPPSQQTATRAPEAWTDALMGRVLARGLLHGGVSAAIAAICLLEPSRRAVPADDHWILLVVFAVGALYATIALWRTISLRSRIQQRAREEPEPMLLRIDVVDSGDSLSYVATLVAIDDPTLRTSYTIATSLAPDWAEGSVPSERVLVHGARTSGPYLVRREQRDEPLLVKPLFGGPLLGPGARATVRRGAMHERWGMAAMGLLLAAGGVLLLAHGVRSSSAAPVPSNAFGAALEVLGGLGLIGLATLLAWLARREGSPADRGGPPAGPPTN